MGLSETVVSSLQHNCPYEKLTWDYQYGFVQGRSTNEAVFKFLKILIVPSITTKSPEDIAKAFNCINHDIFDIILANRGFENRVRPWFNSYNKRSQCIQIDDKKSHVSHAANQRTVLRPTIFILYFDIISTVFEINGALGAWRAHFRGRAHVFHTCAPDVRAFFHPIVIAIYQRSAQKNSRVHSLKMNAPERRPK